MQKLVPYKTLLGARQALDNGGRIYNLVARADDDTIDPAELARAAGVFSAGTKAFLFLEMALMHLPPEQRAAMTARLSPGLQARYAAQRPSVLQPSAVEAEGQAGSPAIVTGYPVFVEDRTQFRGFVMLVVKTVIFVPIYDQFDVYEVFDTPDRATPRTVIATARGSKRLDNTYARFGGLLKELYFDDKTGKEHGLYLETMYYTPL